MSYGSRGKLKTYNIRRQKMNTLAWKVKNLPNRLRGLAGEVAGAIGLAPVAKLYVTVYRSSGRVERLGLVSTRVVTTVFVNYVVDAMQNSSSYPMDVFKYHASGTGTASESASDTSLGTEVGSRVAGSQGEGASPNIYKTVATISYSGSYAITEHGVFSASTGGVLLDRSKFSAINVSSGDSIQFTYELTLPAGG
jgi:hypothetical protein